jgi:hypothetical protein
MTTETMIIDEQLPRYDVVCRAHRIVEADAETTWRAAAELDFMTVHTPLMDAAMWVRGLPARLRGKAPPTPARLSLAAGDGLPGWLPLGERKGVETAFGAVGRFWVGTIEWRDVPLTQFAGFDEPGYGKIACNLSVRPYGADRTLLTYECRVATTDPTSHRRFRRYWTVVDPFVAHIMRATVKQIGRDAYLRDLDARRQAVAA